MKNQKLVQYFDALLTAQKAEQKKQGTPYISRVENPEGTCNTLWVPLYSSNRTASLNLNHELCGFDENGTLWGANGNCETPYAILEVPNNWNKEDVDKLAKRVCEKMDKTYHREAIRVLKADDRLTVIRDTIKEMSLS